MKKVKALITLVVGKGEEVPPDAVCEVSDDEAKRLIALGFAKAVSAPASNTPNTNKPQTKNKETDDDKPDQKSGGQPVSQTGDKG